MNNEPDSPSNPFSDCHSTNVNYPTVSIKERSNFFEKQAQLNNNQNNVIKSPTLRPTVKNALPLSPKIRQGQNSFQQQQKNSYNYNNSSSTTNGILNNKQNSEIDNPFSDSNKIAISPSDDGSPTSSNFLNPNDISNNNINRPPSPVVPNKPLALRTSPRVTTSSIASPSLKAAGVINSNNKRFNDASPQTVGLSNDFKKLHLNIAKTKNADNALVNPFSPIDTTPSSIASDELDTGTSPLIHNDGNNRLSMKINHNKDKETSKNNSHLTISQYTLSPEEIHPSQTYTNPISKAQTISGVLHSLRQGMPVLEPSPASKLAAANAANNVKHSSTVLISNNTQQPPPLPERPILLERPPLPERPSQFQIDGIHASNSISNPSGDKIASRRAVINIDASKSNRATPYASGYSKIELSTKHHSKCIAFCNQYLFSGNSNLSVYNTKTGMPSNMVTIDEKIKITSILLIPGKYLIDEGNIVWVGCDKGYIYEIDNNTSRIIHTYSLSSAPIVGMFYNNDKIWAVSEKNIGIWTRDETNHNFSLTNKPTTQYSFDIPEFDIAYVLDDKLWLCNQKLLTVLGPYPHFTNKKSVNLKVLMGKITCIAEAGFNSHEIYTGHDDGRITIWDTDNVVSKEVFSVSYYNITSILTVNEKHVWVGLSTGKICVFDTSVKPWKKIKDFEAHFHSGVSQLVRDPFNPYALVPPYTSVGHSSLSVVASLSDEGDVHFWDAFLSEDYINNLVKDQESYYSERYDLTVYVTTYNCDSTKPQELLTDEFNKKFFDNWFKVIDSPDIIIVGLQEIVDLESKTVNAKSFFKKAKKKSKKEKLDNRQQIWVDAITNNLLTSQNAKYENISCTQMVGLFLAVFVKPALKDHISCVHVDTVETGLKGYHGNKGSIALRMLIDDSSVCIINTHLAAHQDQVVARNNDVVTIMNETKFPPHDKPCCYVNGGDGSQIMDYENVFWFGDMNYRIDPVNNLTREDIIKMANEGRYDELIKMDQFHNIHSTDTGFPLYPLTEGKINFAPTFKYDIGFNHYDTSEKQRIPSWCDRILYRGTIQQLNYQRHECTASDHRPVSSSFKLSIKKMNLNKYQQIKNHCYEPCNKYLENMVDQEKIRWVMKRTHQSHAQAEALLKNYNYNIDLLVESRAIESV